MLYRCTTIHFLSQQHITDGWSLNGQLSRAMVLYLYKKEEKKKRKRRKKEEEEDYAPTSIVSVICTACCVIPHVSSVFRLTVYSLSEVDVLDMRICFAFVLMRSDNYDVVGLS